MSGSIKDTLDTCPLNDKDKNVLHLLFGNKTCRDDILTKIFWYLGLAILVTIFFLILSCRPVRCYMESHMDNPTLCLGVMALIFFIGVLIIDWIVTCWRLRTPLCCDDPCDY